MGVEAGERFIDPQIYHNKFGSYYVPLHHHRPAVEAIKRGEVWEAKTLKYIQEIYEEGTSVVHAGAYFGDMLPFFSKLVGKQQVFAFEPVRANFLCAKKNCRLNKLHNVALFQRALSNQIEMLKIATKVEDEFLGGGSTLHPVMNQNDRCITENVLTITLDQILKSSNRISLIHLDVEGHEVKVLQGAKRTLARHKPVLILEIWESKAEELDCYLNEIGYKKIKAIDGNGVYFPL